MFNLFNAKNPNFSFSTAAGGAGRLFTGTASAPISNPLFMKPNAYAGDAGQPEQRVGQIGFRFSF